VIISEDDEDALFEALHTLPYRLRKPKKGMARVVVPDELSFLGVSSGEASSSLMMPDETMSSDPSTADEVDLPEVTVQRTFIQVVSPAQDTRTNRTW